MPFDWDKHDGEYWTMTLRGAQSVDRAAPVAHGNYFEADAFAPWPGHRLASKAEWENATAVLEIEGNFADRGGINFGSLPIALRRPSEVEESMVGGIS